MPGTLLGADLGTSLPVINVAGGTGAKSAERYSSLLGGHSDVLCEQAGDLRTFIEGKQMRPLVFFGDKGMPQFPGIPASKDLGLDIRLDQIRMIGIRADTDPAQVKRLADALAKAAKSPEFTACVDNQGSETGFFMSGDAAVNFVQDPIGLMKRSTR